MKLDYRKPQFLMHPIEDCVLRTTWNEKAQDFRVFVRFSGEEEYEVGQSTRLFTNANVQAIPISEKVYEELKERKYLKFLDCYLDIKLN